MLLTLFADTPLYKSLRLQGLQVFQLSIFCDYARRSMVLQPRRLSLTVFRIEPRKFRWCQLNKQTSLRSTPVLLRGPQFQPGKTEQVE